jgi:predicted nucleic acid-binding protein
LAKLAAGDPGVRAHVAAANERRASVLVSAATLAQTLRGGAGDAAFGRVLDRLVVSPVSAELGRRSGEILATRSRSGQRRADDVVDAIVAATALAAPRPVLLLTGDPDGLGRLVDEAHRPRHERVAVVRA